MIERYARTGMKEIWSDKSRFKRWLRIEIAVAGEMAKRGEVPVSAIDTIRKKASFDVARIGEIEKRTRHDVIAFLECIEESVGPDARWLHLGMTSSDLLDTTLGTQIRDASAILMQEGENLVRALVERARGERDRVAIGRTHGIYAEPITYGVKFALWKVEVERGLARLDAASVGAAVGKISGAVGMFAHLDPEIEEAVLGELDLQAEPVASQIVHRDRHAAYLTAIALLGASLEKIATEIRGLQRSDVGEVQEPFRTGQKGSSAMPHKRNPIVCERVAGMARLLRGNALAAMENVALWHERDISHSSVERIILPDSTMLLDYMLHKMTDVIAGLRIIETNVRRNLDEARSTFGSGAVLLALARKGFARSEAYGIVQTRALEALETGRELEDLLLADSAIREHLTEEEIRSAFDEKLHTRNVDAIFRRAGVTE